MTDWPTPDVVEEPERAPLPEPEKEDPIDEVRRRLAVLEEWVARHLGRPSPGTPAPPPA